MKKQTEKNKEDQIPRFNLGVVVNETGVHPDTLRAWERRYGLPEPQRTEGGHRLYSQQDIDAVLWLKQRQEEGMRISQAVNLWKNMLQDGENPELYGRDEPLSGLQVPVQDSLADLRSAWVQACLDFDESEANMILTNAMNVYPVIDVSMEILRKGLIDIGDLWFQAKATVQQEHFASALAVRKLNALLNTAPSPFRKDRVILACPPGEQHVFSILFIALMMRYQGWDVIFLGADTPGEKLNATIKKTKSSGIILSAARLVTAASLKQISDRLDHDEIFFAYGGRIFEHQPQITKRIKGLFLGNNLVEALNLFTKAYEKREKIQKPEGVDVLYEQLGEQFLEKQQSIEIEVHSRINGNKDLSSYLSVANLHLRENLAAAIALGDIDLMKTELDHTRCLLNFRNIPAEYLKEYLEVYRSVISDQIARGVDLVSDWFSDYISRLDDPDKTRIDCEGKRK